MLTERQLFLKHLGQTSPKPMMLDIVSAQGSWLYSDSGNKYLDLISGVCVSNSGHCNPSVVNAVSEQAGKYMHLMVYGEYIQTPQVRYAEKLASVLPGQLDSVYFVNSGSEAIEGAMKLARRFTMRENIISFTNSYHGSTYGALSIQGSEIFRSNFRPLLPGCFQIPFNSREVFDIIDSHTACVIVEPIQAEAGVILPAKGFLEQLREKCTEKGALLVFDEVQTAFGRTGAMTASEKFGVTPDIIVLGKALGGGMPLGAFVSSASIMNTLSFDPPLGHITTFGGHPVSCSAGLASIEVLIDNGYLADCNRKSQLFRKLLKNAPVKEIRGEGLLLAVVPEEDIEISAIVEKAPEFGIITDYFLFCASAFRIAPPLSVSDAEIEFACKAIAETLLSCKRK